RGANPPEPPSDRLESWKDIAAYLRRDVRTVQRWERTDGLPVHRHKRAQRPIPYAYKSELDAWWTSRSEMAPQGRDAALDERQSSRTRALVAAVATVLIVAVTSASWWIIRSRSTHAASPADHSTPRASIAGPGGAAAATRPASVQSVAVLAFLDLSEGMKNEEFADGIAEEL